MIGGKMYAIMRSKKHNLKGGGLKSALMHLYRERDTPNANLNISNFCWDDGEQTTEAAISRLHSELNKIKDNSGRKIRSDAVVAIEYVMTASPEFFPEDEEQKTQKAKQFSQIARDWIKETYPEGKIIAAQIHMDELTPHLSIFVTPTVTKEIKNKSGSTQTLLTLDAKNFLGGRQKLSEQQDAFSRAVSGLGLKRGLRGSKATHQSVNRFYGDLMKFEGPQKSIENLYLAEVNKLDKRMIGGKDDLVEIARKMSEEIAQLKSNYRLEVARGNRAEETRRLDIIQDEHRSKTERLEKEISELESELTKSKNNLKQSEIKYKEHDDQLVKFKLLLEAIDEECEIINSPVINEFIEKVQKNYDKKIGIEPTKSRHRIN